MLALLFARCPSWLPVAAAAALPFRIPIAAGGSTANLLVPLYVVVAAGVLAYAIPRLAGAGARRGRPRPGAARVGAGRLGRALRGPGVLLDDFDHALENVVFFYVPFALLFVLLAALAWTPRLARGVPRRARRASRSRSSAIGFVEYATRHLFLNPKVIASNQFEDYFRVNSLFFDPNIYGRFLAIVMVLLVAWLLWARRRATSSLARSCSRSSGAGSC